MFALGNLLFACGIPSARDRSFKEARSEIEVGRRRLLPPLPPRTRPAGMQTEPQLEPATTSAGVILPETGQFLLLCSLQWWQQPQRCRQTRARVPLFLIHFTSVLRKQFAANDMFVREANSYKQALTLRNLRQYSVGINSLDAVCLNSETLTGADLSSRADQLPKFEYSKVAWNYRELIICMYRTDVRASHYNNTDLATICRNKFD